ncbi:MAG: cobalamin-dependent protein [Candidatus Thorarchaeota archaeon]|jgi:methylmalonyl-CoA mutase cobalamin-binding domain/chain
MALDDIEKALINLDVDGIAGLVKSEVDKGVNPQEILTALTSGLDEVGRLYETNEYFLVELVLAGETMKEAIAVLEPHMKADEKGDKETVIVATVKGDNHDIGKNILITMMLSAGFDIVDLGIDCPAEKIVNAVKETNAKVVALSCLLTMTVNEISKVGEALTEVGLRDRVKIIVGGAPLSMDLARKMGADDYGADAIDGVRRIKALLEE